MSSNLFFTPGPAQLYHTTKQHFINGLNENIGSISHRSGKFQDLYGVLKSRLIEVLDLPEGYDLFFVGSATEIWERIVQNLIHEQSHHFINGSFSKRFFEITTEYKLRSTKTEVDFGKEFASFDVPSAAELISVTLNETSTGYQFTNDNLKYLRKTYPDKLIALDIVSATPAIPIDFSLVDTAYFSVQKCFGLPAGLGVWIVNEKCQQIAMQKAKSTTIGSYHSLPTLKASGDKNQTPETPNVLLMYVLSGVCQDMLSRGIKHLQNETIYKSEILYQAFEQNAGLRPFIAEKPNRSKTVCVAHVEKKNNSLIEQFAKKGLIIGKGYGPFKDDHIRVANFPAHSKEQIEQLVDYLNNY